MRYCLALLPIIIVLLLMVWGRWGAHRAGPAGWFAGLAVAAIWFGLNRQVFWVSQAKGLLLSAFVLAVMWPALFLFHWVEQQKGVSALAQWLQRLVPDRGMCLILLAWSVSGTLEGIAGFGLPVAVVAPMLAALGVRPLVAVAAVAVGHSWAVSFGSMGVILQTLAVVTNLELARILPWAALLLGAVCLLCGLVAAWLLGEIKEWPKVAGIALAIGGTQYLLAVCGLAPIAAFGAGLAGLAIYLLGTKLAGPRPGGSRSARMPEPVRGRPLHEAMLTQADPAPVQSSAAQLERPGTQSVSPVTLALSAYGAVAALMAILTLTPPLQGLVQDLAWKPQFGAVSSEKGFLTPAGPGQVFKPFAHPGTMILAVVGFGILLSLRKPGAGLGPALKAARATWNSAGAATVGIVSMVGLSTIMDHCGMSFLLAQGLSRACGSAYPLVSPWVGMLGAFATGSNNNSNVLFGFLQKNVALLLHVSPVLLVAAQTAGGALGSMLAPAKIIVGCSTVGVLGQEGQVLRKTIPYGLGIGLVIGVLTLCAARLSVRL